MQTSVSASVLQSWLHHLKLGIWVSREESSFIVVEVKEVMIVISFPFFSAPSALLLWYLALLLR